MNQERLSTSPLDRPRAVAPYLLRICLAFILLMAALFGAGAWWSRNEAIEDRAVAAADLARAGAHQMGRVIDMADIMLIQLRDTAVSTDWRDPDAVATAQARLERIVDRLPYVFRLFIIDAGGRVRASSMKDFPSDVTAADRDYFITQRDADAGLVISTRLRSKATGEPIFVLSRRVSAEDDSFLGIVSISFEISAFGSFYETIGGDIEPAFQLIGPDMTILVSQPPLPLGAEAAVRAELRSRMLEAGSGSLTYTSKDGVERVWSYRKVGEHPLYVSAGFATDAILAAWSSEALLFFILGIAALTGLSLLSFVAVQRARGEDSARLQLMDANKQLERRVRQRTAALEETNNRLQSAVDSLEAQTERLNILNRSATSLAAELDLERLVQAVTDAGVTLTGAAFGAFFYNLRDERGESYTLYTLSGAPREAFAKFPMPRNTAVFGPTFRGDAVVRSGDITKDPRYGKKAPYRGMPEGHLPVRSYLAVPVVSRSGEVLGGLFFGHSKPDMFTEATEHLMTGIAAQAAIGIDNARLYQAAQREITDRTQTEQRLAALLGEKTEMLKEIHHRVRNNLQVIASLLNLEIGRIADRDARAQLATVGQRIDAIARVHEQLYTSDSFSRIDLRAHLEQMAAGLRELYKGAVSATITVDAEPLRCDLETAIPLGLIVNELIINSLKHAFPEGQTGTIRVGLQRSEADEDVHLTVGDDGVGMSQTATGESGSPDGGRGGGLGQTMIAALVQQIDAEMEIMEGPGTKVLIRMPQGRFKA
ncbi:histidine kinase dimerization/phosphoacceptor domain -containing protein [Virgifigura deserti]|uniref:histidine kinase dimerization/phosphoacceptor domain -containing protein n=1 Tax=Virgifigura deserti TaxID=2268457 RepID=UPI003CCBE0E5